MKEAGTGLAAKVPRRLDLLSVILVLSSTQLTRTDFIPKCQCSTLPSRNASLYPLHFTPRAERPRRLCRPPVRSGLVHTAAEDVPKRPLLPLLGSSTTSPRAVAPSRGVPGRCRGAGRRRRPARPTQASAGWALPGRHSDRALCCPSARAGWPHMRKQPSR